MRDNIIVKCKLISETLKSHNGKGLTLLNYDGMTALIHMKHENGMLFSNFDKFSTFEVMDMKIMKNKEQCFQINLNTDHLKQNR